MCSRDQLQAVDVVELRRDLVTEQPPSTSRTDRPRLNLLGVRPYEIAEGSLVGDLLCPCHHTDLVDRPDLRAQSSVNAEELAVNDRRQDEEVEDVAASLPNGCVPVLLLALLVESINLGDLAGLVVPSYKYNTVRVSASLINKCWFRAMARTLRRYVLCL